MEKKFTGYLILNWKTGKMEVRKKGKRKYKPVEIPIRLEIVVEVPERKEYVARGRISLSEEKVKDILVEEI
ncbi:MAG TPA: hypothetical protein ENG66_01635 [Thermococcus sp.]|nr:hypothetical protein [Thermococcus sp.]